MPLLHTDFPGHGTKICIVYNHIVPVELYMLFADMTYGATISGFIGGRLGFINAFDIYLA